MQVGDLVTLTDARGKNTGKVTKVTSTPGMVTVEWDSGVSEQIHESELRQIGVAAKKPVKKTETLHDEVWDADEGRIDPALLAEETADEGPLVTETGRVLTDADVQALADEAETGYDLGEPKHPSFRERLSALWDSRPGK